MDTIKDDGSRFLGRLRNRLRRLGTLPGITEAEEAAERAHEALDAAEQSLADARERHAAAAVEQNTAGLSDYTDRVIAMAFEFGRIQGRTEALIEHVEGMTKP